MPAWGPRRARARRRKVVAIVAAGVVALAGVTVTSLATWFDEEWVSAGVNGIPGFSTSSFAIEQRTVSTGAGWEAHKSSSAPGVVSFGDVAQDLAPGAQTFGWVMVRATQDATVGGTITLRSTYTTGDSALGDALRYSARLIPDGASCTAGLYDTAGVELVPDGSTLDTDAVTTFRVEPGTGGAPGAEQIVCFELEFPAGSGSGLQGQSLEALWVLEAESD